MTECGKKYLTESRNSLIEDESKFKPFDDAVEYVCIDMLDYFTKDEVKRLLEKRIEFVLRQVETNMDLN